MRLRRMILPFAAAVSLNIGIALTVPIYAAVAAPAVQTASVQVNHHPNNAYLGVDVQTFSNCGEFNGQLYIYHITTSQDIFWEFVVDGSLYVHCAGGTADLYAYWKCDGISDGGLIATTASSEAISGAVGSCDSPMGGHVLLCYTSSSGGACTQSKGV